MKLLLTSGGVKNTSIHNALVDLLGKPIFESSALFIPTGVYPFPGGARMAWRAICGRSPSPLCELGWKSLGVLELTALPTIREENWVPLVREADALLVGGGDVLYLIHWMRQSGLANLLPSLSESVYVGVSAGSIVVTPYNCDAEFDLKFVPPGSDMARGADRALGLVDFTLYPHLDHPDMPDTALANIEKWASGIPVPTYAIDDETAIKVAGGNVEVVSEGHWTLFSPYLTNAGDLPVLELAAPGPQRDSGVQAILSGTKTAMTGLPALHEQAGEPLPTVGDRFCVVDSNGRPAAVIEMTRVGTEPISAVTDDYAHAEGRGYRDAAHWRRAHEEFFQGEFVAEILGGVPEINDDTLVLTQRFRLVGRPSAGDA